MLILAGGSGTRLWPASTENTPKQFLDIDGAGALLLKTLRRCALLGTDDDCFVITRKQYALQVAALMTAFNPNLHNNVILEPMPRNTAPAILLAAKYLEQAVQASLDEVMMVCPSDHLIQNDHRLMRCFELGMQLAEAGSIVTFGVVPDRPETGYGYIKADTKSERHAVMCADDVPKSLPIEAFKEKPNLTTAEQYVHSGNYYWNAGIFAFTLKTLYQELETCFPEMAPYTLLDYDELTERFHELPAISFDFAVMEKTTKSVVIPLDVLWSDVGSWDSVYDILPQDEMGNAIQGPVLITRTQNALLINQTDRPVATIGLQDVIVVQTENGLLIANRRESQDVRLVTEALRQLQTVPEKVPAAF